MFMKKDIDTPYSPLYFLAALGNGGLTVAFFIFFMFMVDHPATPIATIDAVLPLLLTGPPPVRLLCAAGYLAMLWFAFRHVRILSWNIREFRRYKQTGPYRALLNSNNEITLMALPLTFTMTINVLFVLGAMLVPGLWRMVEYLLPIAFLGFFATGLCSLRIFYRYYSKLLLQGHFNLTLNNSLGQMISSFAFAMNAVGFAAPAAMSGNRLLVALATFCSLSFLLIAALLAVKNLILGFHAMLDQGINREGSASLWILIPILTLLGITVIRLAHGFHLLFAAEFSPVFYFVLGSAIVSLQLFFGLLGYQVMRRNNYFTQFIHGGDEPPEAGTTVASPAAYALICPGVAFWVFGMFFLDKALIHTGLLELFSLPYFLLLTPLLLVLLQTLRVNAKLNSRLLP